MTENDFRIEAAAQIENKLGLPTNFLWNLQGEDDWSAIIKLHALLETAVTHLLVRFFGHNELEDIFANMELGNLRTGKLAILSKLNCLEKTQRGFIRKLSEIRNDLVHDIRNVRFSLSEHIRKLNGDQYRAFLTELGVNEKARPREWVQKNAKVLFVAAGISCLSLIYLEKKVAIAKQKLIQKILSGLPPKPRL